MDRYDTAKYAPGMVYELNEVANPNEIRYGNAPSDDIFMIVSSVKANSRIDTVMLAPIIECDEYPGFGIQFITRRSGRTIINTVCVDRMFKAQQKRLKKLRYVVADDVVRDVNNEIQIMLFGEALYSRTEALGVAYKEELTLRAQSSSSQNMARSTSQFPVEDSCVTEDYKPLSQAEMEAQFAKKMMKINSIPAENLVIPDHVVEAEPAVEKVRDKNRKVVESKAKKDKISKQADTIRKHIEKTSPKHIVISGKKEKPKAIQPEKQTEGHGKYKSIYEHWEDFLPDYATLPSPELMNKYNLPDVGTVYRIGKECKKIAKQNGVDVSVFRKKVMTK